MAPKDGFLCSVSLTEAGLPEKPLPTDRWLLIAYLLRLIVPFADFQCMAERTLDLETDSLLACIWALPLNDLCNFEERHLSFLKVSILIKWEGHHISLSGVLWVSNKICMWNSFVNFKMLCKGQVHCLLTSSWRLFGRGTYSHGPQKIRKCKRKGWHHSQEEESHASTLSHLSLWSLDPCVCSHLFALPSWDSAISPLHVTLAVTVIPSVRLSEQRLSLTGSFAQSCTVGSDVL